MDRQVSSTVFRITRIQISSIPGDQSCNMSAEEGKNKQDGVDRQSSYEAERQFFFLQWKTLTAGLCADWGNGGTGKMDGGSQSAGAGR